MNKKLILLITAGVLILSAVAGQNQASSQEPSSDMSESGKNLADTETITLTGKLQKGDFKLLMDITPYVSKEGHVALKVPCGENGESLFAVVAGIAPDVSPLELEYVAPLSNPPSSCVYHVDIGEGITDIALLNTSDKTVIFFGKSSGGYSATITIHGELGSHE